MFKGLRYLVDRKDRRDLSIFQIALRFIERYDVNDLFVQLPLCIYRRHKTIRWSEFRGTKKCANYHLFNAKDKLFITCCVLSNRPIAFK
jgi:hypothetical protein